MIKKFFITIHLTILIIFLLSFSVEAMPEHINYQGKLTSADGAALNGDYDMNFQLFLVANGGTSIWNESQTVTVVNGIYNVKLGIESHLFINILFSFDIKRSIK